jgi:hypothetical protein
LLYLDDRQLEILCGVTSLPMAKGFSLSLCQRYTIASQASKVDGLSSAQLDSGVMGETRGGRLSGNEER